MISKWEVCVVLLYIKKKISVKEDEAKMRKLDVVNIYIAETECLIKLYNFLYYN